MFALFFVARTLISLDALMLPGFIPRFCFSFRAETFMFLGSVPRFRSSVPHRNVYVPGSARKYLYSPASHRNAYIPRFRTEMLMPSRFGRKSLIFPGLAGKRLYPGLAKNPLYCRFWRAHVISELLQL